MIILLIIIGLSLLIFIHELGHFLAAKWAGMHVHEFSIGFPPRIFKKQIGETQYSIGALLFGGFVRLAGEQRESVREEMAEETIDENIPPEKLFYNQPAWKRAIVLFAGVFMNIALGWLLFSAVFMVGTPQNVVITDVLPDSVAEQVGLQSGDIVRGFNDVEAFIAHVDEHPGEEIVLAVLRGGEEVVISAVPTPDESGASLGVYISGGGVERQGFFRALASGAQTSVDVVVLTVVSLWELVRNLLVQAELLDGVVGPVGIVSVAQTAGNLGIVYFMQFLALISVNLGVLNLVPFPALDGGRLVFLAGEKIKGSPLSWKVEAWANGIGFVLLIALMVALTIRDIGRFF